MGMHHLEMEEHLIGEVIRMKKYYLAYGSNLNLEQMKRRCPNAKPIGTGVIWGYKLAFIGNDYHAFLNIVKCDKGAVVTPVAVWEVDNNDIESLDRYEGYPDFYRKEDFEITLTSLDKKTQKNITGFAYVMTDKYSRHYSMPENYYFLTVLKGYLDFRFDIQYLKDVMADSLEEYINEKSKQMSEM